MKFIVRWLFRLLILAIMLAIATVLLKDTILKELAEVRFRRETGLEVDIGRLEVGLLSPTVTVEDLKLYNPPEFGGAPFVVLPELHFEYDRGAFATGALHLRLLRVNLAEISFVQNAAGQWNIQVIKEKFAEPARAAGRTPLRFAGIDTLNLTLGRVRRQRLGAPAEDAAINLGVRGEVITNLKTEKDLYLTLARLALRGGLLRLLPPSASTNVLPAPLVPAPSAQVPSARSH